MREKSGRHAGTNTAAVRVMLQIATSRLDKKSVNSVIKILGRGSVVIMFLGLFFLLADHSKIFSFVK